MGEQGEMGEGGRNLRGNHFWQSRGLRMCVCDFCNFMWSGPVADARLCRR